MTATLHAELVARVVAFRDLTPDLDEPETLLALLHRAPVEEPAILRACHGLVSCAVATLEGAIVHARDYGTDRAEALREIAEGFCGDALALYRSEALVATGGAR